jgi:hypothetical protein
MNHTELLKYKGRLVVVLEGNDLVPSLRKWALRFELSVVLVWRPLSPYVVGLVTRKVLTNLLVYRN